MPSSLHIVLVTAPDADAGRKLAGAILEARAAACVNIVPGLESHYWWQGKIESAGEVLMILKTSGRHLSALKKLIVSNHPYDTPEFAVLNVDRANKRYLQWLTNAVR